MSQIELRPGLADVPVAESAVSFIDGKRARLEYRGIAVETLARESCFEETAWLLLKGDLPTQQQLADFDDQLRHHRRIKYKLKDLIKCLPGDRAPDGRPAGRAWPPWACSTRPATSPTPRATGSRSSASSPSCRPSSPRSTACATATKPIEPRDDLDHAANFYYMLFEQEPSPAVRKVLDACLILHAEHTMNASTFSGRVTGSTLANPYTVISSAIGTLTGPLHGGANEEVLDMLDEIGTIENVKAWLEDAVANKKKIMGFGHRVYKVKDPRATVLQELAEHVFAETEPAADVRHGRRAGEAIAAGILGPEGHLSRTSISTRGIVYQALGIPRDLFTPIFAIARVAGWLAHWLEQLKNNRIFRPEQIYVGKHDVPYVPLEKRP